MESLEQMQARHLREQKDLRSRIKSKKNNATKRTRKGINDECARLEYELKERQEMEVTSLTGSGSSDAVEDELSEAEPGQQQDLDTTTNATAQAVDGLAQKLESASMSPQEAGAQEPVGLKKKRNRQKERLARRAAEQEAAAIAAEKEAANMVDHKTIEKTYMLKEFKANSLEEKDIQPDGHCLFSAVADQLQQRGMPLRPSTDSTPADGDLPYQVVRHVAAGFMESNPEDFAPFMEEALDSYVTKIRDTPEWGGQLELLALARAYNVEIAVVQEGRTEVVEPGTNTGATPKPERIWLAYYRHGYGLGEHYNSLRKKP